MLSRTGAREDRHTPKNDALRIIEKERTMPEREIVVKETPEQYGIAMREVVAGTASIPSFMSDGFAAIGIGGVRPSGPPLTIYHDPEFDPAAIDMELFIPVAPDVLGPIDTPAGRHLIARTLAPARVATLVHVGPYDTLGDAYQALASWIGDNGYVVGGPPQEIYMTGPDQPGPPVTEIRMPVQTA